jgi:phosphohistidine phosphatase
LLEVAQNQQDDFSDLLIVGHNPGLTDLVNRFLPEMQLDNLPTGGIVAMDFETEAWAQIQDHPVRLAYYDYPKNPEVLLIED